MKHEMFGGRDFSRTDARHEHGARLLARAALKENISYCCGAIPSSLAAISVSTIGKSGRLSAGISLFLQASANLHRFFIKGGPWFDRIRIKTD